MIQRATVKELGRHRLWWARLIWFLDLLSYGFLATAGVFAVWFTPDDIAEAVQRPWIVAVWGVLLLVGGVVALVGRAIRMWAVELFANVFAAWGAFLFSIILTPAAIGDLGWFGVLCFAVVAWLWTARRYAELKIFTNEPGLDSFKRRLDAALRRRTDSIVPLQH